MSWEQKYLKYKKKYLELQIGGGKCKGSSGVPVPPEVLKWWEEQEEKEEVDSIIDKINAKIKIIKKNESELIKEIEIYNKIFIIEKNVDYEDSIKKYFKEYEELRKLNNNLTTKKINNEINKQYILEYNIFIKKYEEKYLQYNFDIQTKSNEILSYKNLINTLEEMNENSETETIEILFVIGEYTITCNLDKTIQAKIIIQTINEESQFKINKINDTRTIIFSLGSFMGSSLENDTIGNVVDKIGNNITFI